MSGTSGTPAGAQSGSTGSTPTMSNKEAAAVINTPVTGCAVPADPTPQELGKQIDATGKSLGIRECSTQGSNSTMGMELKTMAGFGLDLSASVAVNQSASAGCENVAIIAQVQQNITKNISCTLSNCMAAAVASTVTVNSIYVGGVVNVTGNFTTTQSTQVKFVSNISLTNGETATISNQIQAAATAVAALEQATVTKNAAIAPGNKVVSTTQSIINNTNFNQKVTQAVSQLNFSINSSNQLVIGGLGSTINVGGDMTLSQNIIFDISASVIVQNCLQEIYSSVTSTMNQVQTSTKQTSTATNVSAFDFVKSSSWIMYVIVGAVVLMVLGGIFAAFKSSSAPARGGGGRGGGGGGGGGGVIDSIAGKLSKGKSPLGKMRR
jgi:hypothetical protein